MYSSYIYIYIRLFVYIGVFDGVECFPFFAFPVHEGVSCVCVCACVCVRARVGVKRALPVFLSLPSVASGVLLGCPGNGEVRLPTLRRSLVQDPRGPAFLHARA